MKHGILSFLFWAVALFAWASAPLFQYADHSVLSTGQWVKVSVTQTGVHKLTYQDIKGMGFDNPQHIKVFGYGGAPLSEHFNANGRVADDLPEVPIFMEKGSDGVFGEDDYILFYAQGPVQVLFNAASRVYSHVQNPYSTKGYYFLTTQSTPGKRIELQPQETVTDSLNPEISVDTLDVNKTYNYFLHEKELVNLLESGRDWYGEELTSNRNQHSITLNIPHITSDKVTLNMACIGEGEGMHKIHVGIAEKTYSMYIYGSSNANIVGTKGTIKYAVEQDGVAPLTVDFTYEAPFSTSKAYIDYVGVGAYQHLQLDANQLSLFYPFETNYNRVARYQLATTQQSVHIWDITSPLQITQVPHTQTADSLFFTVSHQTARRFLAVKTDASFPAPQWEANVANQDLHALRNVDMVIITAPDFYAEAERLAQHHRLYDGYQVKTLLASQIYNEFSSGTPDATAYRWLMKMLYDKAETEQQRPKHLLFMGVAYYDNRGLKHPVPDLLSFQSKESLNATTSYITDDYFTLLEDNEGNYIENGSMDIGVGRFPVTTVKEAQQCVDKTIRYATQSALGDWRNSFTFLADDGDGNVHMKQANALADTLFVQNPSYKSHKIWLDAYPIEQSASGATYPKAREEVLRRLKEGTLVFTYVGHGSTTSLSAELTITGTDISYLNNANMAVWITATCDFSRYDNYEQSAGMKVLLNPNGGGIASFTTTRVVYSASNNNLAQAVFHEIVPQEGQPKPTLGEVVCRAKKRLKNDINKLNFSLLGDPAITLKYPDLQVVTDSINGKIPDESSLPALGLVTIKASVRNPDGEVDPSFQGYVHVTMYDKAESFNTLSGKGNDPFEYTDYKSILFQGDVQVQNGLIEFSFMMPKDINYALDKGRLVYYLTSSDNTIDGHGSNHDFSIGGTATDIDPSHTGPVARVYLNSPGFVSGQQVNSNPVFFAHLYDEYGINTVGAGIGHDITLRLSNQPSKVITLNDYYQSSLNDYKNGVVRYPMPTLTPGKYQLEFKAWNLQNISTTSILEFEVVDGLKPAIEQFSIYPNPIRHTATLSMQYDRPDDVGSIAFMVYDLAGQLCWQSSDVLRTPDGYYQTTLHVNSGKGMTLKPGMYVAHVQITTSEGTMQQISKKIIVLSQ